MGRKPKLSARVRANLQAARKLGKVTREEIQLRKEQARVERLKVKAEGKALRAAEYLAHIAVQAEAKRIRDEKKVAGIAAVDGVAKGVFSLHKLRENHPLREAVEALQASEPEFKLLNPSAPPLDYIATANRDGQITRTNLPAVQEVTPIAAMPDAKPTARIMPALGADLERLPIWVREKRGPTRAELASRHHQTEGPATGPAYGSQDWFAAACAARNRR
jgi:ribosomal protein L35